MSEETAQQHGGDTAAEPQEAGSGSAGTDEQPATKAGSAGTDQAGEEQPATEAPTVEEETTAAEGQPEATNETPDATTDEATNNQQEQQEDKREDDATEAQPRNEEEEKEEKDAPVDDETEHVTGEEETKREEENGASADGPQEVNNGNDGASTPVAEETTQPADESTTAEGNDEGGANGKEASEGNEEATDTVASQEGEDQGESKPEQEEKTDSGNQPEAEPEPAKEEPEPTEEEKQQQARDHEIQRNKTLMNVMLAAEEDYEAALRPLWDEARLNNLQELENKCDEAYRAAMDGTAADNHGKGTYDLERFMKVLGLKMTPSDLVDTYEKPKYETVFEVERGLQRLIDCPSNRPPYTELLTRTLGEVKEVEARFNDSQVNLDVLDQSGFHQALPVLSSCMEVSIDHMVMSRAEKIEEAARNYTENFIPEFVNRYDTEAALVEATSAARLRPTRPEEVEEFWEASSLPYPTGAAKLAAEAMGAAMMSPVLQEMLDRERNSRVCEIPDEEWQRQRRDEVLRLKAKAEKVVTELDTAKFNESFDYFKNMLQLVKEKKKVIHELAAENVSRTTEMAKELRECCVKIQDASAAFRELKAALRCAAESDEAKVEEFVREEASKDEQARVAHQQFVDSRVEAVRDYMDDIHQQYDVITQAEKRVVELKRQRRVAVEELVAAQEAELQRRSLYDNMTSVSEEHRNLLKVTMNNYRLSSDEYPELLQRFVRNAEDVITKSCQAQTDNLDKFGRVAAGEGTHFAATMYIASRLMELRKAPRVADLATKAEIARKQREFCAQTQDPAAEKYTSIEDEILALREEVVSQLETATEQAANAKNEYLDARRESDAVGVPCVFQDPEDIVQEAAVLNMEFIVQGFRPPIVNCDFGSTVRLVVPNKYYTDFTPQRALASWGGVMPPLNVKPSIAARQADDERRELENPEQQGEAASGLNEDQPGGDSKSAEEPQSSRQPEDQTENQNANLRETVMNGDAAW